MTSDEYWTRAGQRLARDMAPAIAFAVGEDVPPYIDGDRGELRVTTELAPPCFMALGAPDDAPLHASEVAHG